MVHSHQNSSDEAAKPKVSQEELNAQLQPIQKMLADLQDSLRQLNFRIDETSPPSTDQTPQNPEPRPQTPLLRPRQKPLPVPHKFSGKRNDFAAWKQLMSDKLELDAAFYTHPRETWYLVYSCLEDRPQKTVAAFYAAAGPQHNYDANRLLEYLERTYGNHNLSYDATASLRTLR